MLFPIGNLNGCRGPRLSADRGYQGDDDDDALNLNFNTATWETNGGMFGNWARVGGGYAMGISKNRLTHTAGKLMVVGSDLATPGNTGAGFHAITRGADNKQRIYGPAGTEIANGPAGHDTSHGTLVGLRVATSYSTARLAAMFIGNGQWSAAQIQALRDALLGYAVGVGVNPG
jgi:hypothetical protein